MKIEQLLSGIKYEYFGTNYTKDITSITEDSRKVKVGSLFVALKGEKSDGHRYIDKAISLGAKVIVAQDISENICTDVMYIKVNDTHEVFGLLASTWYNHPSRYIKLVGVTGTNGKTTTATLLYRIHQLAGYKVGLISTVCNYIDKEEEPATHTTPAAMELQGLIRKMVDAGCTYAFMEVSSHAADQKRIAGLEFDGAIFSNLTRDHLDYHQTVENYLRAKKKFFDGLDVNAFALVNADEKTGQVMLQNCKAHQYTYGIHTLSDFHARVLESHIDHTLLEINQIEVIVQLVGQFNVYNLLAVYGATVLLGMDRMKALTLLSQLTPVAGRFQTMKSPKKGYLAIVDYAHTPDALVNVLDTIRPLIGNHELYTVVGCGGDRDPGKRPMMAKVCLEKSDKVILTSDNPRTEDPECIIKDMKEGIDEKLLSCSLSISNRKEAIRTACMMAKSGDVVLIAGKGHETYQEINGVKYPFDDREVVRSIFDEE